MTGNNFKFFQQWIRKNGYRIKNCSCGCYDGEHDPVCAQVVSEELLYEQWQAEMAKAAGNVN